MELAGSAGPHVFVESLDTPLVSELDLHHLTAVLRLREGDELTVSDGDGGWRTCVFGVDGALEPTGPTTHVAASTHPVTVAFSLVKGQKPELAVQKLTELGIDQIVVLSAERSVVKWDDDKIDTQRQRWSRIIREAAMQSHRVRLPQLSMVIPAVDWLAQPEVLAAQFGGGPITARTRSVAVGPEGGWAPAELAAAGTRTVSLGPTVLRAETAAIASATLLCAPSLH